MVHRTGRMLPIRSDGKNLRRHVGAARRRHGEIGRDDKTVPDLLASKTAGLDLVVNHHVIRLLGQRYRIVTEGIRPSMNTPVPVAMGPSDTGVGPSEMIWNCIPSQSLIGSFARP